MIFYLKEFRLLLDNFPVEYSVTKFLDTPLVVMTLCRSRFQQNCSYHQCAKNYEFHSDRTTVSTSIQFNNCLIVWLSNCIETFYTSLLSVVWCTSVDSYIIRSAVLQLYFLTVLRKSFNTICKIIFYFVSVIRVTLLIWYIVCRIEKFYQIPLVFHSEIFCFRNAGLNRWYEVFSVDKCNY